MIVGFCRPPTDRKTTAEMRRKREEEKNVVFRRPKVVEVLRRSHEVEADRQGDEDDAIDQQEKPCARSNGMKYHWEKGEKKEAKERQTWSAQSPCYSVV